MEVASCCEKNFLEEGGSGGWTFFIGRKNIYIFLNKHQEYKHIFRHEKIYVWRCRKKSVGTTWKIMHENYWNLFADIALVNDSDERQSDTGNGLAESSGQKKDG